MGDNLPTFTLDEEQLEILESIKEEDVDEI